MNKIFYDTDIKDRSSNITRQKAGQYDWETPLSLFEPLNKEFNFTLDPCATPETAKCPLYFTPDTNGLAQD